MTVVIKQVEQIEIYLNDEDDVVIFQSSARGDDPGVVVFPMQHLQTVIDALKAMQPHEEPAQVAAGSLLPKTYR